ncbi:hypothetical protein SDC9_198350 [bioreactor metagenome]|uniref:Uncharacterized protein n=1 Tax=bioreactor metagenome TaxID=1076179 RepID=A0A645IHF6_9ZZZZ
MKRYKDIDVIVKNEELSKGILQSEAGENQTDVL